MTTSPRQRILRSRQSLFTTLLSGAGLIALGASVQAQTTYTFTNTGTGTNPSTFQNAANWSPMGIPTSTATTSDTATFDGTGGGNVVGTPLVLTDTVTDGGGSGTQGISLILTAGQAGGLTLNDSGSVRLASVGTSTATATNAVTMASGAGPLTINSVVIGGLSTATFSSFTNNSASTYSIGTLQAGGGAARTLIFYGSGNYAVTGNIIAASSALNITKGTGTNTDPGTLTFSGTNNTYTGVTTINSGPLVINNSTSLGAAGTATNTGTGAAPAFTNTGDTVITSGGGSALNTGQLQLVGGASGITVAETFVVGGRSAVSTTPATSGTNLFLNVSGANTLSGTVNFSSGGTDYGIRADAGSLSFTNAIAPFGGSKIFDITGNAGVVFNGVISNPQGTGTPTTTINRTAGFTGTLVLSANNLYSGGTNINGGTVFVSNTAGSATGTNTVTIATTGTLAGGSGTANGGTAQTLTFTGAGSTATRQTYAPNANGIITGAVVANAGSNLSPGNTFSTATGAVTGTVGTLTVGALTLNANATISYEFNDATNDLVAVTGALNIAGTTNLNLYAEGTTNAFSTAGVYNIFTYGSGSTITTSNLTVANPVSGLTYAFVDAGGVVQLDINGVATVPEPATWLAGMLTFGLAGYGASRRARA